MLPKPPTPRASHRRDAHHGRGCACPNLGRQHAGFWASASEPATRNNIQFSKSRRARHSTRHNPKQLLYANHANEVAPPNSTQEIFTTPTNNSRDKELWLACTMFEQGPTRRSV